jgi:sporulation protein YlmC with PRC-barrel domain
VRLTDLLGLEVRSESGHEFGRVHDVRAELKPRSLPVTGLVVGKLGLLERLCLGAPGSRDRLRSDDVIAWSDVVRADRRGVIVKDGAEPGRRSS